MVLNKSIIVVGIITVVMNIALGSDLTLKESRSRVEFAAQEAINELAFGMSGVTYENFEANDGALRFVEIFPLDIKTKSGPSVKFIPPTQLRFSASGPMFCTNFTAVAVHSTIIFSVSSLISFYSCSSLDINLAFKRVTGVSKSVLTSIINSQTTIENLKCSNPLARILGLETTIKNALSKNSFWSNYIDKIMKMEWALVSQAKLNQLYENYLIITDYPAGSVTTKIPYLQGIVGEDSLTTTYGKDHLKVESVSDAINAFEAYFPFQIFEDIYKKAMDIKWTLNLSNSSFPSTVNARLDTITFGQVVPDILIQNIKQNLTAKVSPLQSSIKASVESNIVGFKGFNFAIQIFDLNNKELLNGEFSLNLFTTLKLKSTTFSARLVPAIQSIDVQVQKLTSPTYHTIIKNGLASIIRLLFLEYYLPRYFEDSLGKGIVLTRFNEKIDPESGKVSINSEGVTVQLYYRSD